MTDDRQIAITGLRQYLLDRANNPRLGSDRRLPAAHALSRMSKERVGGCFELLICEVTRRRSVILAEIVDDGVTAEPEPISEN